MKLQGLYGSYRDYRVILGRYWENGKENANYYNEVI